MIKYDENKNRKRNLQKLENIQIYLIGDYVACTKYI